MYLGCKAALPSTQGSLPSGALRPVRFAPWSRQGLVLQAPRLAKFNAGGTSI